MDRVAATEQLAARRFDLLVIGGGIIGAGIAEVATAHGLDVALVERGDFAGATSSASSKLVHGGLRYLQMGDVRLVREAHQERRALMSVVAPHLVRRLPFLFPLYDDGPHRPWFVRTGVLVYSAIARAKLNGRVSEARALRLVPALKTERLHSSALYADAQTNDGRLTIANVRAAADRGAVVLNYAEVTAVHGDGADVVVDGEHVRVTARSIVNATGPWLDHLRRLEDDAATPSIRLSKGVHLIVDGGTDWSAAVTIPHDKVRVSFAIPWEGKLLLGTTDTLHEGEPEDATGDRRGRAHGPPRRRPSRCTGSARCAPRSGACACCRAAPERRRTPAARRCSRTGPAGMVSVAGGKLTTYRRIALDALEHLGVRNLDRAPRPLPGATGLDAIRWPVELDPATRSHLLHSLRLARARGARARARRSVAARAARPRPPRPAGRGALRPHARMGAHRRGRPAAPHDRLARRGRLAPSL